jgi:deoxyribodipyrimidine photolyase-related protein
MIFLLFPNQLFYDIKFLSKYKSFTFYLIEEPRYMTDFKFHKLKLAYHRASMKKYYDYLKLKKFKINYIEYYDVNNTFYKSLNGDIYCFYPADYILQEKLNNIYKTRITILETLNYLISQDELSIIKPLIYKSSSYSHSEFYKYQRKKLNILIDKNSKPISGKWSYDNENRLALPKNIKVPKIIIQKNNKYIWEIWTNHLFNDFK